MLKACDAIAAAHALDIVHRDLKPSNLFLADRGDGTGVVKVLDFGISKVGERMTPSAQRLTRTAAAPPRRPAGAATATPARSPLDLGIK